MKKIAHTPKGAKRGELVTGPSGVVGRYVGKRGAIIWIAWEPEQFEPMVKTFDSTRRA